ncbi:MAG TPA: glycosyl hydrolase [Sphingobium sp.]|uniref:glycosyl hydrolase n=1 Tax=Sphingobium sp. TaxID=1912891 RepID=UPI002ED1EE5E
MKGTSRRAMLICCTVSAMLGSPAWSGAPGGTPDATEISVLAAAKSGKSPAPALKLAPFAGLFAKPPMTARPRIRFWTPQAAVSEEAVRQEIDGLYRQGFGGVELVAMKIDRFDPSLRWGTPRWDALVAAVQSQAGRHGMAVSLTNGPAWPIAMPSVASADDPASLFELTYGAATIAPGQSFDGPVPERRVRHKEGTTQLLAVLAYRTDDRNQLDPASCIDLTPRVAQGTGSQSLSFQPPPGSGRWTLLSFWEQPAVQKVGQFYVIDHLSAQGAAASTAYWDKALKKDEAPLADIFNDSLEYDVALDWTRGMRDIFRKQHAYDLVPYLPFIGGTPTYPKGDQPAFASTDPQLAERVRRDYRDTLTALYIANHLTPLQRMAERHGTTIRYQAAYNKPLSIESAAAAVGVPETEALGRNAIDGMRQMAAAVHLLGKPRLSIESAAEFMNTYGQTLRDILWWTKRAWAAGVNIQTLHGASYSGRFDGPGSVDGAVAETRWPGFEGFRGPVSANWNRMVDPATLRPVTDYMARMNLILQKTAKVDLAIYRDEPDIFVDPSKSHGDGNALYADGGLLNALGYSYDLLSSALLAVPQAVVAGKRLAPAGPAYRALIVPPRRTMGLRTLGRITALAKAGLPVILVGDMPSGSASQAAVLRGEREEDIRRAVSDLLRLPTAAHVPSYGDVPAALRHLGVRPDAQAANQADILVQHRSDRDGEFYYLYNYNKVSNSDATITVPSRTEGTAYPKLNPDVQKARIATFSLVGTGRPYRLNGWSGRVTPLDYRRTRDGRAEVTLAFAADEAVMLAMLDDRQAARAGAKSDRFPPLNPAEAKQSVINDWSLTVEAVSPPLSGPPLLERARHEKLGPYKIGSQIAPWPQADPALAKVSGMGTYEGSFTLGPREFAVIDLGRVENGISLSVNGRAVEGIDQLGGRVDLTDYARSGDNMVTIRVASTLETTAQGLPNRIVPFGTDGRVIVLKTERKR